MFYFLLDIICSDEKRIKCDDNTTIRVHDVIYGHVVGRNECNTRPTSNCTAPNGFCAVAEKAEGRQDSEYLNLTSTISPAPCGGRDIYIIVDYSCVKSPQLSGKN